MLGAADRSISGRIPDGERPHQQVCQRLQAGLPCVARSGGNNRIVPLYGVSERLWVLSVLAGGTDHANLFIPVRSLPEDLLAPDDHSRA